MEVYQVGRGKGIRVTLKQDVKTRHRGEFVQSASIVVHHHSRVGKTVTGVPAWCCAPQRPRQPHAARQGAVPVAPPQL
jgi:hypothetical protein